MAIKAPKLPNINYVCRLGGGGGGEVYLAEQEHPRRRVAIKIVSPESVPLQYLRVLKEEGDIAAQFEHDNLVVVYECGICEDHYYIVEQYLSGGTLTERIDQGISPAEAASIVQAIASALAHIHSRGYVHRDVKPGNILFAEAGKPVLADFGIAKAVHSIGLLTEAGYTSGTPAYMSPEQIQSQHVDGRSDLYSLGIVLYEMLTGHRPFSADSDFEIRKAHVEDPPPRLPTALSQFQPILDRLLAKRPDDRYASGEELIKALEQIDGLPDEVTQGMPEPVPITPGEIADPVRTGFGSVTTWFHRTSKRRIVRVIAAYLIVAWGFTEIFSTVSETLELAAWTRTAVVIAFVVALPVAVVLSWLFDVDANGVYRVKPNSGKGRVAILGSVLATLATTTLILAFLGRGPVDLPDLGKVTELPGGEPTAETTVPDAAPSLTKESLLSGLGILRVHSVPDGARVLLDDIDIGTTPLEVWTVRSGRYELRLEHEFSERVIEPIELFDNVITTREIDLPTAYGALTILTRPDGAWIEIDGVRAEARTPAMLAEVEAGLRRLRVGLEGHATIEREIRVTASSRVREELALEALTPGQVSLDLSPPDAEVVLVSTDGYRHNYGRNLSLPAGRYNVEASAPGYADWEGAIEVGADASQHRISLVPLTTRLFIDARPPGASIRILTLPGSNYAPGLEIPRGQHRVRISHPGYETAERLLDAREASFRLDITLVPTPTPPVMETAALPDPQATEGAGNPLKAALETLSERRFDEAFLLLMPLAEAGDAIAQTRVADLYAAGLGTKQDDSAAVQWYTRAASQNQMEAQARLGTIYENGIGVQSDEFQAYVWYSLAARNGYGSAAVQRERIGAQLQPVEIEQARRYIEARFPEQ